MKQLTEGILEELLTILNKIRDNKIYGSVEIFFENGEMTQITQRIINKVRTPAVKKKPAPVNISRRSHKEDDPSHHSSNLE